MAVIVELFIPNPIGSPEETPMTRVARPIAAASCPSLATTTASGENPLASRAASIRRSPKGATAVRTPDPRLLGISSRSNSNGGAVVVWLAANIPSNNRR